MENTPKNFALQLGSLISLYVSITALLILLSGLINTTFPDAVDSIYAVEAYSSQIRFSIALLIVFFPSYLVLTRIVNKIRRTEHGTYLTLTKWLIYLSLIVGGGIILGDLVALINGFLNGDLTTRFLLKVLAFFLVVGSAFVYYIFDARGYWQEHEKQSIQYGTGALMIVIAALVLGFMHIDTPQNVREQRIDTQQVNDLVSIQSHIDEYYYQNESLPETIADAYQGLSVPEAVKERAPYTYAVVDETRYELCAEFAFESKETDARYEPMYLDISIAKRFVTWEHGAGEWCFEREAQEINSAR